MKYKDSGVDIDAASRALARAKEAIRSTWGDAVASDVGHFGGLFRRPDGGFLVSSIDGVGTKLKVALAAGRVDGVGADLVNHCVDDILVQGAEPLFFLDYFAAGRLDGEVFVAVVEGMARACRENGCALIGGETAEMPGIYHGDDFDLAGCIVGEVRPEGLITGEGIRPGMEVWGWPSTGLHTNGYSLARRVLLEGEAALPLHEALEELEGRTLAEALLAVHRSYLARVRALRRQTTVHGLCHLTGGGFVDNLPRVLPPGTAAVIDAAAWEVPPIFSLIARRGRVDVEEMRRVYNLGIGMVVFLEAGLDSSVEGLDDAHRIGAVVERDGGPAVRFENRHRGLG